MDAEGAAAALEAAADAVEAWWSVGVTPEASGERVGQYRFDLAADAVVVPLLVEAGFGVLSEESGMHHAERDLLVVVDPVDGSTNAARGLPVVGCSLAVLDEEGLLLGLVVELTRGVRWRARRGRGASRDGLPIRVRRDAANADAVVGVNGWLGERPAVAQTRTLGCASVELCLVAEGTLDGYVNLDRDGHGPWDYLGGLLVALEAGAVVAELAGRDLSDVGHDVRRAVAVAANVELCRELVAIGGSGRLGAEGVGA